MGTNNALVHAATLFSQRPAQCPRVVWLRPLLPATTRRYEETRYSEWEKLPHRERDDDGGNLQR